MVDDHIARSESLRNGPTLAPVLGALVFGALILSACADDNRPDPQARRATATLFISPAGKPFHGEVGQPYPVSAWFAEADANRDGKLTREEFRADFAAFFRQLDVDHNGTIDGLELSAYEQNVAPEVLPRLAQMQGDLAGDRQGRGHDGPRQLAQAPAQRGEAYDGAPEYSLLNISEPVAGADADFDGRITLEEFLAAADRRFELLDMDHKGFLTLASLPKTPEQKAVENRRNPGP